MDYLSATLTPTNLSLCNWGNANIAEYLANVIGQKFVDLWTCPHLYLIKANI